MVGEISEVTKILSDVVIKQENNNETIEKKNNNIDAKLYNVDSIKNNKLEELIQSYTKIDKDKKNPISTKIKKERSRT